MNLSRTFVPVASVLAVLAQGCPKDGDGREPEACSRNQMGFVMTCVMAWFYNLFAARFGGLEVEVVDDNAENQATA